MRARDNVERMLTASSVDHINCACRCALQSESSFTFPTPHRLRYTRQALRMGYFHEWLQNMDVIFKRIIKYGTLKP